MNADLLYRLNSELKFLEYDKEHYEYQLSKYKGAEKIVLRKSRRKGRGSYYCMKMHNPDKVKYLGNRDNPEVIRVCKAHFLDAVIRHIDHNIALLRSVCDNYLPYDEDSINASLPATYAGYFVPRSDLIQQVGMKWREERLEFKKQFPENHPERNTNRASDGTMVKSISEVLIYEQFISAGLFPIYELPLPVKDHGPPLYPDFTVLSPIDLKTEIIVEFIGRLDLPGYREAFAEKLGRYINSGFTPYVDLFFIYNDANGNIDSMQIAKIIAEILGI